MSPISLTMLPHRIIQECYVHVLVLHFHVENLLLMYGFRTPVSMFSLHGVLSVKTIVPKSKRSL